MSEGNRDELEAIIRNSGEKWLIEWYSPRDEAMNFIRASLKEVRDRALEMFRGQTVFSEEILIQEYQRNPQHVRAFLQIFGSTRSPDILLMAWRILSGMEIQSFSLSYQTKTQFELVVQLISPYGDLDPEYRSTNVRDLAIFRHIGSAEIDGKPVLHGFYPLRLADT